MKTRNKLAIRTCAAVGCENKLAPKHSDQRYCSRTCASASRRKKEQEEAKRFIERLDSMPDLSAEDYEPTSAIIGSARKVEVMRQRVQRGEPLFHPNDRRDFEGMVGGSVSTNGAKNEKRNRLFAWRFSR